MDRIIKYNYLAGEMNLCFVNMIECPCCLHGKAQLHCETTSFVVKDAIVESDHVFYKCDSCKEEFTTTETDTFTLKQIYRAYMLRTNNG